MGRIYAYNARHSSAKKKLRVLSHALKKENCFIKLTALNETTQLNHSTICNALTSASTKIINRLMKIFLLFWN